MHRITLAILLLTLLAWSPVQAQDSPQLSNLKVSLWPEYDRPEMLVIYIFSLSPNTSLPVNLTMRIPAVAGDPHAVAVGARDDLVADVPYTRSVSGEWAEISFIASMPSVQFEYYDPSLNVSTARRSFVYYWPGDYGVESMMVEVQQPLQATTMSIAPSLGSGSVRADGMTYFTAEVGRLNPGQNFNISLDYEKTTSTLSAERLEVQPSQPLTPGTTGRIQTGGLVPVLLGGLGIFLIVGGGVWYWRSGQRSSAQKPRRRRRAATAPTQTQTNGDVYCSQCGKRAAQGDRFCRSCGRRLKPS
jgi:hypothetical protein